MTNPNHETIIGYAGFVFFEEAYPYVENSCFIGDTQETAEHFMKLSQFEKGEYRIDSITMQQVLGDIGGALHDYAMEPKAFERFRAAAQVAGVDFEIEEGFDGCDLVHVCVKLRRQPMN